MRGGRAILGPALIYAVANAGTAAIPLLLLPLLTRVLTPDDYGLVAMFGVIVQMLGALTGLSVHGAIGVRFFDRQSIDFPRYVGSCLSVLSVSLVLTFCLVAMTLPALVQVTKLPASWLLFAVLVAGANFIIQSQLAIFQSAGRPISFGVLRIGQAAADLGLSLLLVLGLGLAWQGRAIGVAAAAGATAAIALLAMWRGGWLKLPGTTAYARSALAFGLPLVPHAVGGLLIASVDRFMISNILDVGSAGIYLVAVQIGLVLNLITDAGNRAFAPWLFEALKQNDRALDIKVVKVTYAGFGVLVLMGLALGLLAPYILAFLVGEDFRGASEVVMYITVGQAFGGMYLLVTNYVFFVGKTGRLAAVSLACGFVNVALSFGLLNTQGLTGAAQAFMFAQLLLFLGTWWTASLVRPMPWRIWRSPKARGE